MDSILLVFSLVLAAPVIASLIAYALIRYDRYRKRPIHRLKRMHMDGQTKNRGFHPIMPTRAVLPIQKRPLR